MAGATADADGLARLAPFQNHPVPVLARAQQFIAAHLRRIGQRAPHQEQIQETRLHRVHADWRERVDIQRTHFDVFDAAAQRASDGVSPLWVTRFGRIGAYSSFSICSTLLFSCR